MVFLAVNLYPSPVWGNFTWYRDSPDDEVARQAFRSLMVFGLEITASTTADNTQAFWSEVLKQSRERYNFTFSEFQQRHVDPIVIHFYESVTLYATIVSRMYAMRRLHVGFELYATCNELYLCQPSNGTGALQQKQRPPSGLRFALIQSFSWRI
ncbi:hypothetical protein RvY_08629 [Ramazzottius varieornatus]|uniref:Uncharacterized protein n=1 Tax=Ramazzottius varieornatus TaxID=947166 RepID=A0A1D1V6I8_RAMVA|nr:hypothetical protein RvY_08629 [Ramazzottius varieornatus]